MTLRNYSNKNGAYGNTLIVKIQVEIVGVWKWALRKTEVNADWKGFCDIFGRFSSSEVEIVSVFRDRVVQRDGNCWGLNDTNVRTTNDTQVRLSLHKRWGKNITKAHFIMIFSFETIVRKVTLKKKRKYKIKRAFVIYFPPVQLLCSPWE